MTGVQTCALPIWLGQVGNDNAQREYYLPDVVGLAVREGLPVRAVKAADAWEAAA